MYFFSFLIFPAEESADKTKVFNPNDLRKILGRTPYGGATHFSEVTSKHHTPEHTLLQQQQQQQQDEEHEEDRDEEDEDEEESEKEQTEEVETKDTKRFLHKVSCFIALK